LNSLGAKTVVFGDPADAVSFKERYPDLGVPTDSFELLTIYEYLDRLVQEGRLKLPAAVGSAAGNGAAKGEARRVAFHDCTHLGRHLGCYDGPRRLIQRLGLELVELWRSREKGLQCGAGMHTAFPRVAD